jgi:hypothetical protein
MGETMNLFILGILVIGIIISSLFIIKKRHKTLNSIIILEKIKEINQYASHEINYFENISFKDNLKLKKLNIPLTGKSFNITVIGKIKLGVNLDSVKIKIGRDNINISIPEIIKISHETTISEISHQTKNPFNQLAIEEIKDQIEDKKEEKEKKIFGDVTILEEVRNDLTKKIDNLINLVPQIKKKYKINIIHNTDLKPLPESIDHLQIEENILDCNDR